MNFELLYLVSLLHNNTQQGQIINVITVRWQNQFNNINAG